jgi:hypothetical protein
MDDRDGRAIEELFGKLSAVERQSAPRDPQAERYIRERIAAQPAAPYYMAQTIIVQEQALAAAQERIEELEQRRRRAHVGRRLLFRGIRLGAGGAGRVRRQAIKAGPPITAAPAIKRAAVRGVAAARTEAGAAADFWPAPRRRPWASLAGCFSAT